MSKNNSNNKKTQNDEKAAVTVGIILACVVVAAIIAVIVLAVATPDTSSTMVTSSPQTQSTASTDDSLITKPVIELKENAIYYADIDIKNYGVITVKLDQKAAPITVSNFINLSNSGFYNGLTFHRIMEGFMMQGGDPNGNGTGGSNQNIKGEFTANGVSNSLSHTRGAISMARATPYDSASSQFFIVHQDSSFSLDGQYAVFGYVKSGMDIVDKICTSAKPLDNNGKIAPSEQPIINSIKIRTVE